MCTLQGMTIGRSQPLWLEWSARGPCVGPMLVCLAIAHAFRNLNKEPLKMGDAHVYLCLEANSHLLASWLLKTLPSLVKRGAADIRGFVTEGKSWGGGEGGGVASVKRGRARWAHPTCFVRPSALEELASILELGWEVEARTVNQPHMSKGFCAAAPCFVSLQC